METADAATPQAPEESAPGAAQTVAAAFYVRQPARLEPDLAFIRTLRGEAKTLKMCFQCGTCSSTCELSPEADPFPRKEMAWATWGLKDRLLNDPDVWLCHQCNDCSTRCPRGARPGDVLAAVRREVIFRHAFPRFLASWVRQPKYIPLLLAIPAVLLSLAFELRDPLERALGISRYEAGRISYSFSSELPHWLLNGFFGLFGLIALIIIIVGAARFWRAMKTTVPPERLAQPAKGLGPSIWSMIKNLVVHQRFTKCNKARPRYPSHMFVFFGFLALCAVTFWVITSRYNPLIGDDFVYPFSFWNPWKVLANLGGLSLVVGCSLMIRNRVKPGSDATTTYFDWVFILLLLFVVLTGFATEIMHFARMEPHRHTIYFLHLVFIFTLLIYLPYSKFAHMVYRALAMVFAEHTGREGVVSPPVAAEIPVDAKEEAA